MRIRVDHDEETSVIIDAIDVNLPTVLTRLYSRNANGQSNVCSNLMTEQSSLDDIDGAFNRTTDQGCPGTAEHSLEKSLAVPLSEI